MIELAFNMAQTLAQIIGWFVLFSIEFLAGLTSYSFLNLKIKQLKRGNA